MSFIVAVLVFICLLSLLQNSFYFCLAFLRRLRQTLLHPSSRSSATQTEQSSTQQLFKEYENSLDKLFAKRT
eukprot:1591961-Rhodomonas_salina.1